LSVDKRDDRFVGLLAAGSWIYGSSMSAPLWPWQGL